MSSAAVRNPVPETHSEGTPGEPPPRNGEQVDEALLSSCHKTIWAVCRKHLGAADECDDAIVISLAKLWRNRDRLDDRDPNPLAARIARNVCLDMIRKRSSRKRHTASLADVEDRAVAEGQDACDDICARELNECLGQLSPSSRLAILLSMAGIPPGKFARSWDGETAAPKSETQARELLNRARAAVAACLRRKGWNVPEEPSEKSVETGGSTRKVGGSDAPPSGELRP